MQQLLHLKSSKKINFYPFGLVIGFILFGFLLFIFEGERTFENGLIIISDTGTERGHLIITPGCKILDFEPEPPQLWKYFKYNEPAPCFDDPTLRVTSSEANVLFFYPENIPSVKLLNSTMKKMLVDLRESSLANESEWTLESILQSVNVSCCYQSIRRVIGIGENVDWDLEYGEECHNITKFRTVIDKHDAIHVSCISDRVEGMLTDSYKNVHILVRDKRKNDMNNATKSEPITPKKNKLNVIIYGIDSVSRLNFLRTQPKTYKFLTKELKAFEYKGYNKVGDNTFPNLVALLSGNLWDDDFAQKCFRIFVNDAKRHKEVFDNCPIIWKDFHRVGYTTALLEDKPSIAIFNYLRLGFRVQPTDHYVRSGFLAAQALGLEKGACLGRKQSLEILLSYSRDFEVTYQNGLTFSLIWATGLTHDNLNGGVHADEPNVKYLKSLKEDGILNKTILFFISDHGMRYGKFRETYLGRYEENLPYLFIVVPEWFHKSYPNASRNLQENASKFSTPLDIYETLRDILYEKYSDINYVMENRPENNKRISLLQSLPETRTCTDIGMPLQYCACQNYVEMKDTDDVFENIAYHLLSYLNKLLGYFPECSKVMSLEVKKAFKSLDESVYSGIVGYLVSVQALYKPGDALIETTLIWNKRIQNTSFIVSGEISRINKYGNQSKCVTDNEIAKICVCKNMI